MTKNELIAALETCESGSEMLLILEAIDALYWYLEGGTFSPFFSNNYLQKVLKNVYKWLNKYTLPFYLVENSSLDTTQ